MKKLTGFIQVLLLILGSIALLVVGWWLWQLLKEQEETDTAVRVPPQRPVDVNIPLPVQPVDSNDLTPAAQPDNLTDIDGIGPKYAQALAALGILTFSQLSSQNPAELAEQLKAQGVRVTADRIQQQTWIAQATRLMGLR
ncbi:DUF4332 domain-containing protein [Chloroflexota bacterium]